MGLALYSIGFVALCAVVMRALGRRGIFWSVAGVIGLGALFWYVLFPGLELGGLVVPGIAMLAVGAKTPLPVPAVLARAFMFLIVLGAALVVSAAEQSRRAFMRPVLVFLRGEVGGWRRRIRGVALFGAFPALAAWLGYQSAAPPSAPPSVARQAHPSIPYDQDFVNPYRDPDEKRLAAYAEAQGLQDASPETLRARFKAEALREGLHLYAANCAPCHGAKADGAGPMARGLALPPADFTDPGTIGTLVEGYAFQRVRNGGAALPASGTPWDSAMPRWKGELSDEEIYKVLIAAYALGGVTPRIPESLE